jgi:hypothetical protein
MNGVATKKIDRQLVVTGFWVGLVLIGAGYFGLGAIPWPRGAWVLIARSGLFPWGLLAMPTVVLLVAAVVAAVRHQDPLRWVSMAIGAAVGALALVAIVVAALGVIAWIAS